MTTSFAECHNHSVKPSLSKPQEGGWVCTIWQLRVVVVVVDLEVCVLLFMLKEFFFTKSMKSLWYEKASSISAFFHFKAQKETRRERPFVYIYIVSVRINMETWEVGISIWTRLRRVTGKSIRNVSIYVSY